MKQPHYTQGKWHEGQGNGEGCIFADEGRMKLEEGGTTLYPICLVTTGYDEREDRANSKLLTAAPDLLRALELLATWSDGFPCFCEAWRYSSGFPEKHQHTSQCDTARKAIERATQL